jgi:vesicle-fusing ATPase
LVALRQTKPGFSLGQEKLEIYTRDQLINYGDNFRKIQASLRKTASLALTSNKQLTSLLMYGPKGSGKTSIACHFAQQYQFTYVKAISPEQYIGLETYGRINSMTKIFNDAYKSDKSLIILDNIEGLIGYVSIGPNYNNELLRALVGLIERIPTDPECHLLVIATSSNFKALERLSIDKLFDVNLNIPLLTPEEAAKVIGKDDVIKENVAIK